MIGISIHDGHRERLKNRFLKHGLDSFEEHEALELLLFYALPRRDTNALAHELLARFGSLRNVFDADPADLSRISGIGESAAALIKLQSELARKYWLKDREAQSALSSVRAAVDYAGLLFRGKTKEEFYIVCLDSRFRIRHTELLARGSSTEVPVYVRQIREVVVRTGAETILLAHNHPGGSAQPSQKDIALTRQAALAMDTVSVPLLDHIIIGEKNAFSFSEKASVPKSAPGSPCEAEYSGSPRREPPPDKADE